MTKNQEYTFNQRVLNKEECWMTLDSILANIEKKQTCFELNESYRTIRYIGEDEYSKDVYKYVEPDFFDTNKKFFNRPRFILFSAPGATGKTALAKYICHVKNGIYWELPDNKVAEYSFQGAITEAVGFENISKFVQSIVDGDNFLVIDAFDEAEASSGKSGVEYFLRDLNNVTGRSNEVCAILLARTESAIFIKDFFKRNGIAFVHYEIGYFAEYNSKTYIMNKLKRNGVEESPVVTNCIDEQFREIHRIFSDQEAKEFLGYAPVLDALATSYTKEKNTVNLLKTTQRGENNCKLMKKILDDLLDREQDKFIKALKNKFCTIDEQIEWKNLYNKEEQLFRIVGMMLFDDSTMFCEVNNVIPVDYRDDYLEVINIQLPQHPFICVKEENNEAKYGFTGPAFKDYVIAYSLANDEMEEYVREFLVNPHQYCPSQMLIEFYELLAQGKIKGIDISLMYNSFKAHAHLGDLISLSISGDENECYVGFKLEREDDRNYDLEFSLMSFEEGIHLNQISNCYIDIAGKVYVGNAFGEARIHNSVIDCDTLIWDSEQILIEAYSPSKSIIITGIFKASGNVVPRFEIRVNNKSDLKIFSNNINEFYKLLVYKDNIVINSDNFEFESFAYIIRRIFACLRSHSKDTPARKMDFIDNRIINNNIEKKKVLKFLMGEKIIYTDEQDWLYKLDTDKLSTFGIMWNDIKNGDFSSLQKLYEKYDIYTK